MTRAVLAGLLSHPHAARLGLTRLAPTVDGGIPAEELVAVAAELDNFHLTVGSGTVNDSTTACAQGSGRRTKGRWRSMMSSSMALTSALCRSELDETARYH